MEWRERLQQLIDADGRSQAEILRAAKVHGTAFRDILIRGQTPSVDQLAKIATALGTTLSALYDGEGAVTLNLSINGVTSGDRGVWSETNKLNSRTVPLDLLSKDCVTIEVRGDDLRPEFRPGDIIFGPRIKGPYLDNYIGVECIVCGRDGSRLIGILLRGTTPGRFNVRPFNLRQDEVRDVEVEWVAPVQMILRNRNN
jgi:transcriptional regulator with XRE-family HTH domain